MSTKYCMKCHEDVDSDDMVDFLGTPFEICKKCDEQLVIENERDILL
jgi:NAD-dependent SIR2 family protein deacetylase